jgi:hypothetical protein
LLEADTRIAATAALFDVKEQGSHAGMHVDYPLDISVRCSALKKKSVRIWQSADVSLPGCYVALNETDISHQ